MTVHAFSQLFIVGGMFGCLVWIVLAWLTDMFR